MSWPKKSTPGGILGRKNSGIDAESARESEHTTRTARKTLTYCKFKIKAQMEKTNTAKLEFAEILHLRRNLKFHISILGVPGFLCAEKSQI